MGPRRRLALLACPYSSYVSGQVLEVTGGGWLWGGPGENTLDVMLHDVLYATANGMHGTCLKKDTRKRSERSS